VTLGRSNSPISFENAYSAVTYYKYLAETPTVRLCSFAEERQ